MPTKNPKYKPAKAEKTKRKINWTHIALGIFAILLIITMLLSMVSTNL